MALPVQQVPVLLILGGGGNLTWKCSELLVLLKELDKVPGIQLGWLKTRQSLYQLHSLSSSERATYNIIWFCSFNIRSVLCFLFLYLLHCDTLEF